jgi:hypothetical protein
VVMDELALLRHRLRCGEYTRNQKRIVGS